MKKAINVITIVAFLLNSLSAVAQESRNGYFAGMGVGTQALDYKGTNVSFEAGRRLGNFEIGTRFSYYYNPRALSSIREESFRGSWEHCKTYSAYLFAGYDWLWQSTATGIT